MAHKIVSNFCAPYTSLGWKGKILGESRNCKLTECDDDLATNQTILRNLLSFAYTTEEEVSLEVYYSLTLDFDSDNNHLQFAKLSRIRFLSSEFWIGGLPLEQCSCNFSRTLHLSSNSRDFFTASLIISLSIPARRATLKP